MLAHAFTAESVLECFMFRIKLIRLAIEDHLFLSKAMDGVHLFIFLLTISFEAIRLLCWIRFLLRPFDLELLLLFLVIGEIYIIMAELAPVLLNEVVLGLILIKGGLILVFVSVVLLILSRVLQF